MASSAKEELAISRLKEQRRYGHEGIDVFFFAFMAFISRQIEWLLCIHYWFKTRGMRSLEEAAGLTDMASSDWRERVWLTSQLTPHGSRLVDERRTKGSTEILGDNTDAYLEAHQLLLVRKIAQIVARTRSLEMVLAQIPRVDGC
ncbi:hypothetical protein Scep_014189 [Stephania cephalantha]|uniref:Uncharacterized protein n=1 Tax=Stephania cephalantha TaxID=152367 RepID=A0AAP0J2L8_9MAGN